MYVWTQSLIVHQMLTFKKHIKTDFLELNEKSLVWQRQFSSGPLSIKKSCKINLLLLHNLLVKKLDLGNKTSRI